MGGIKTIRTNEDFKAFKANPKGRWRAFKMTLSDGRSMRKDRRTGKYLNYAVGKIVTAPTINLRRLESCGSGVHIASLQWLRETRVDGMFVEKRPAVFLVEFNGRKAIVPLFTEGKFRVRCVKVLARVSLKTGKPLPKKVSPTRP